MKIGDMVQYVHHTEWDNSGLGVIVDTRSGFDSLGQETHAIHQIAWLDDIEDHGWEGAITEWAIWYEAGDFESDIRLFAEAE